METREGQPPCRFLLCCYGCIFRGTENLAQLCRNLGISDEVV
jgi:hypothetical protein